MLEWTIWLVYGIDELNRFYRNAFPDEIDAFWSRNGEDWSINPVVASWMTHMTDTSLVDGEQCYSIALRRLLIFVRDKLLVPDSAEHDTVGTYELSRGGDNLPKLDLTPASGFARVPSTSQRAKSKESYLKLEEIGSPKDGIQNYMHNPKVTLSGQYSRGPSTPSRLLTPFSNPSFRQEVNDPLGNR